MIPSVRDKLRLAASRTLNVIFLVVIVFGIARLFFAHAATPNPGHPWSQVGDGLWAATGTWSGLTTFTFPNASATVLTTNAAVTTGQGGTNLTSSGALGNVLTSDGSNWISTSTSMATLQTRPFNATGATSAVTVNSLTSFRVGLFNVPQAITVNQMTYNVTTAATPGTFKVCVYAENGSKIIDGTSATNVLAADNVAVSAALLKPGNYYIAMGCATTCSDATSFFTSTLVPIMNGTSTPAGKKAYEGTVTMTSGTCNATLPAITAAISSTPDVRLDN